MSERVTVYVARFDNGDRAWAAESAGHAPKREAHARAERILATHVGVERVDVERDGRVWLTVRRAA